MTVDLAIGEHLVVERLVVAEQEEEPLVGLRELSESGVDLRRAWLRDAA